MPDVQLYPSSIQPPPKDLRNPLPQLLQTPSGLALLELQGTINLPVHDEADLAAATVDAIESSPETAIGCIVFPDYDPQDGSSSAWMKRVYMYVGKHQRLTGEVKKLPKALAVIRKRRHDSADRMDMDGDDEEQIEELEVVEIVKYKILFSTRPEPVGALVVGVSQ